MSIEAVISDAVAVAVAPVLAELRALRERTRTLTRLRPLFADLRGSELGEPEVFLMGSQP